MEIKGLPPRSLILVGSRKDNFFDENYKPRNLTCNKLREVGSISLESRMQVEKKSYFVDFIDKCIEWKPENRMTPY